MLFNYIVFGLVLIRKASELHWSKFYSIKLGNKQVPLLETLLSRHISFYQAHNRTFFSFTRAIFF